MEAGGFVSLLAAVALGAAGAAPAAAAGPGASSDAYGLLVDTTLQPSQANVAVGPLARAAQDFPRAAPGSDPDQAAQLSAGPYPADGSLVQHVGVSTATAGASGVPTTLAKAEANDVQLLKSGPAARITADSVTAQANADCASNPDAAGTAFVNLQINGTPLNNPAPNTVIDLGNAKVIINEQRRAADGRGFVVNAIHLIAPSSGTALFTGDVIVGHAASSVACTNGAATTGGSNSLTVATTVSRSAVGAGGEVGYAIAAQNNGGAACPVRALTLHTPPGFEFVRASGGAGTGPAATTARPGGVDITLGGAFAFPAGGTLQEDVVLRVTADARSGDAFVGTELRCASANALGGLAAPVTLDLEPPDSAIDAGPSGPVAEASPEFRFSSGDASATFECRLDEGAFAACASPLRPPVTGDGAHVFRVRAIDAVGNADPTPAERGFTIDTTPPDTVIGAGPAGPTKAASGAFAFSSPESGATFECQLDDGPWDSCTSPRPYPKLADGPHTFRARARDLVGHVDTSPATRGFTVDTARPGRPRIVRGPRAKTRSRRAAFRFRGEARARFQCKLDRGKWKACRSPRRYRALRRGHRHVFSVRQIDRAGNVGRKATRRWTVRRG
jgi:hypothetical protein